MKKLNGRDLADFIKERQRRQSARAAQDLGRRPHLAIIKTIDDVAINTYVRLKQAYGADIGIDVMVLECSVKEAKKKIEQLNGDSSVDAVIVQLPLAKPNKTDELLQSVDPNKDVDGLHEKSIFDSATATAILWLLAGYNVNLAGKEIAVVGQGRLVGKPVSDYLEQSGHSVVRCDKSTVNLDEVIPQADIIITATGEPGLIKSEWIKPGAVVVDAGVAGEDGKIVGDVDESALARDDISITPARGGLGPLTVCALFENVLKAAS